MFRTEVTVPDPLVLRLGSMAATLKAAGAETRAVLATLTAERLEDTVRVHDREAPIRWNILMGSTLHGQYSAWAVLCPVIDHSAVHLGHMQITGNCGWAPRAGPAAAALVAGSSVCRRPDRDSRCKLVVPGHIGPEDVVAAVHINCLHPLAVKRIRPVAGY